MFVLSSLCLTLPPFASRCSVPNVEYFNISFSFPPAKQQTSSKQSITIIQIVRIYKLSFNTACQAEEYRTQKSIFKIIISFSNHAAFRVRTVGATLPATHPLAQHPLLLNNHPAQMKGQDTYDAQRWSSWESYFRHTGKFSHLIKRKMIGRNIQWPI